MVNLNEVVTDKEPETSQLSRPQACLFAGENIGRRSFFNIAFPPQCRDAPPPHPSQEPISLILIIIIIIIIMETEP